MGRRSSASVVLSNGLYSLGELYLRTHIGIIETAAEESGSNSRSLELDAHRRREIIKNEPSFVRSFVRNSNEPAITTRRKVEKNELLKEGRRERLRDGRRWEEGEKEKVSRAKATPLIGIKGEKFPRRRRTN